MDKKVLEQYLDQKLNITIFDELDSTNNYLKKLGSQGEKENKQQTQKEIKKKKKNGH